MELFRRQAIQYGKEKGSPIVKEFYYQLSRLKNQKNSHRKALLQTTGVTRSQPIVFQEFYLPKLQESYPPMNHWIADTKNIHTEWEQHLETYKLSDSRHHRYPSHLLDVASLKLDILPNMSAIIYDAHTKDIVGVVVRNFSNSDKVLTWATDILKRSTEVAKSVRVSIYIKYLYLCIVN